eukprot:TRINITY_DN32242_c0_g1_i1.p3 TRINITY_DN32242_c0_g1~~TRINITY_DN32242_c0_g1_i1.p3  ORF type:complete len:210 (+),score=86.54 TRINITY_DN32242_c0_g1_i1:55-684(+)
MGRIPDKQALYPTIAVSDAFNVAGHVYGAWLAWPTDRLAGLGLAYVAVAAAAGVLRFGVCRGTFRPANEGWADAAAYVGLPLLGHRVLAPVLEGAGGAAAVLADEAVYMSALLFVMIWCQRYCRSDEAEELSKVAVNLLCFAGPLLWHAAGAGNTTLLAGVALFVLGGVAVGNERERFLLGMRRENIFHYIIGVAAYLIGAGIGGVAVL